MIELNHSQNHYYHYMYEKYTCGLKSKTLFGHFFGEFIVG